MELHEYETMAAVEHTHWWYRGMRSLAAAWLDQVYLPAAGVRILDAGCGTGGNAAFLKRYGDVSGVDLAPLALELGRRRLEGGLARASVLELPFGDASFDLVCSFDVLYHRDVIGERDALAETLRVLRPGGRLLIRLPAYRWLYSSHDRSVHTRARYTAGDVRALLVGCGFQLERLSYINSLPLPIAVSRRLLERVMPAAENGDDLHMAMPSAPVNTALGLVLSTEAAWLRRGGRFPAGLSVLALARKEEAPAIMGEATAIPRINPGAESTKPAEAG